MEQINVADIVSSLPGRLKSDRAADVKLCLHLEASGERGGSFTIRINNGLCTTETGISGEADCKVETKDQIYIDIESGNANPQMMVMTGKLKISNLAAMMEFSKLFHRFDPASFSGTENVSKEEQEQHKGKSRRQDKGPLQGIRILDFSRLLPGPMATMLMADMGADVIKVENPDSPDYVRNFPPFYKGKPSAYLALNRSKRSLAINLRSEEGKELIHRLLPDIDIVVESFRPGIAAKIGISYKQLKKYNEKVILLSLTGYGQEGPYAHLAGHDLNYIGYAGILGLSNRKSGHAFVPPVQIADIAGGAYQAVSATLAALWARERSGQGDHIDLAMIDGCMPMMGLSLAASQCEGFDPQAEMPLSGGLANYHIYECADGGHMAMGALEPKFWHVFCVAIEKPDWSSRFPGNEEETAKLRLDLEVLFASKKRADWIEFASHHDCCLTPVLSLQELQNDPHLKARNMIVDEQIGENDTWKTVGIPPKFKNHPAERAWPAPELGEDTDSILLDSGLQKEAISVLRKKGIIG